VGGDPGDGEAADGTREPALGGAAEDGIVVQDGDPVPGQSDVDLDDVGAEPGGGQDARDAVLRGVAGTGPVCDDEDSATHARSVPVEPCGLESAP
jgi:hypothetical protein